MECECIMYVTSKLAGPQTSHSCYSIFLLFHWLDAGNYDNLGSHKMEGAWVPESPCGAKLPTNQALRLYVSGKLTFTVMSNYTSEGCLS